MSKNIDFVLEKYPSLDYDYEKRCFHGTLQVSVEDGDSYHLEIFVDQFPNRFPIVWETRERIPRISDRHCNDDGSLCFTTPPLEEILLRKQIRTIEVFISDVLIPFLQNNSYYEINGKYRFGEHSHNWDTAMQHTFIKLTGLDSKFEILALVDRILAGLKIRPNSACYCGSGKKIKKCNDHSLRLEDMRRIKRSTLIKGRAALAKMI